MQYKIKAIVDLTLNHNRGDQSSTHVKTDINIDISKHLDRNAYFNKNGTPNELGSKSLTIALVQGLVGNIHAAHGRGYWDSAEHLRYIIAELEKGFIQVANTHDATFDNE